MAWAALVPRARLHTMGWKEPLAVPLLLSVPRLQGARQAAGLLANQEQHLFTSVLQYISVLHLTLLLQGEHLPKPDLQRLLPSTPLLHTCSVSMCTRCVHQYARI